MIGDLPPINFENVDSLFSPTSPTIGATYAEVVESGTEFIFSDDESRDHDYNPHQPKDFPPMTWEYVKDKSLRFGKWKGVPMQQMIQYPKRRGYLRYILTWDKLNEYAKEMITCALNQYKTVKELTDVSRMTSEAVLRGRSDPIPIPAPNKALKRKESAVVGPPRSQQKGRKSPKRTSRGK
jgi:hypothetical protein